MFSIVVSVFLSALGLTLPSFQERTARIAAGVEKYHQMYLQIKSCLES